MSGKDRKRRRKSLERKQGPYCYYCGLWFPMNLMTIDHVVPMSKGGTNNLNNLVLACYGCNRAKADSMPLPTWSVYYS